MSQSERMAFLGARRAPRGARVVRARARQRAAAAAAARAPMPEETAELEERWAAAHIND